MPVAIIETPRYSFTKYTHQGGKFIKEFISPLPTLFNYGYIAGTTAADGMGKDVIVLGKRLTQGTEVTGEVIGRVSFTDDGVKDDKSVMSEHVVSFLDRVKIHVFFSAYMIYKIIRCAIEHQRLPDTRYGGMTCSKP